VLVGGQTVEQCEGVPLDEQCIEMLGAQEPLVDGAEDENARQRPERSSLASWSGVWCT
jgi:hypothetical protein